MRSLKWDDSPQRSPVDEVRTKMGKEQRGAGGGGGGVVVVAGAWGVWGEDEVKTGKKGGPLASRTSAPIKGLGAVCHSFSSFVAALRGH